MTRATINQSVEHLYRVFGPYRDVQMQVEHPSHLHPSEHPQLVDPALEDVGYNALGYYLGDTIYVEVDKNVDFFKRFIPRICEAIALEFRHSERHIPIWLVMSHFASMGWGEWRDVESEAIDSFWGTLWAQTLRAGFGELHFGNADEVFTGMPFMYADLQPMLADWREQTRRNLGGALGLARLVNFNSAFFRADGDFGLGWPDAGLAQILGWLREPDLIESLDSWLERYALEDEVRWSLRDAVELLGIYRDKP